MNRVGIVVGLALLAASSAQAQNVKLRFSTWAGGDGLALLQQLAKEYNQKNPNVQVVVEVTPFADYARKVAVQIASNDAPDVGWLAERDVPAFLASKAVLDLKATVNARDFNLADFPASTLALWKQGQGVYGVPFSNSPQVLFYNKDLFQRAGVPDPMQQYAKGTWDYAAFQAAAKAIKDKTGAFGARIMRLDPKAWNSGTLAVLWSNGGGAYDKNLKCSLNSAGSVRGLQLMHDMMFKDGSMPRPGDQTTFETGRIGMYADNVSYSAQMRGASFKWGIAPMPKGPGGRITQLGQAGYVVFAKTAHPKEASDFLKFLASPEVMARTAKFFPPPRKSVLNSREYLASNPAIPASSIKTALVSQLGSARVFITGTNFLRENDVITSGFDRLFQPNANVKNVVDGICRQIDSL
ncbi:multiple sugar transport system substrate-binding protein [Deinobacterium chartae]|uniref:Multiple sugar transport system substrate-binding protein n=1 Tax=Deinobacterium chartae TaxID=521158 RepID=A0A841I1D9_9DEIO|nr:sugar ABC transporter substrate-binding protein [Deinobacterium chartae]MBB6098108.1 multiple sugar transport system substrate-binding protein [Deinobacterium chartae]